MRTFCRWLEPRTVLADPLLALDTPTGSGTAQGNPTGIMPVALPLVRWLLVCVCLCAHVSPAHSLSAAAPIALNLNSFEANILQTNKPSAVWAVLFTAKWSGAREHPCMPAYPTVDITRHVY